MLHDHENATTTTVKLAFIWIMNHCISDFHEAAGNISIILTICYVIWKWRRDYKNDKRDRNAKDNRDSV